MERMIEFYNSNADFKLYVDRHCKQYGVVVVEALKHEIVRQVYLHYLEVQNEILLQIHN